MSPLGRVLQLTLRSRRFTKSRNFAWRIGSVLHLYTMHRYNPDMRKFSQIARFAVFLLAAIAAVTVFANAVPAQERPDFAKDTLVIETDDGTRHTFDIELAVSPTERAYGLMFLTELEENRGMLFDYGRRQRVSMWMKNTFIPLDMLFISEDGTIARIVERTTPRSLRSISSHRRVRGVLEVRGGTVDRLGIEVGDRVIHAIFE